MAKFIYGMQNLLNLKEKLEEQKKSSIRSCKIKARWRREKTWSFTGKERTLPKCFSGMFFIETGFSSHKKKWNSNKGYSN